MSDASTPPVISTPTKRMIDEIVFLANRYRVAHGFKAYAELSDRAVGDRAFLRKILASPHPPAATVKKLTMLETFLMRAPLMPGEAHDRFVAEWRAKHLTPNSDTEHSEGVSV